MVIVASLCIMIHTPDLKHFHSGFKLLNKAYFDFEVLRETIIIIRYTWTLTCAYLYMCSWG